MTTVTINVRHSSFHMLQQTLTACYGTMLLWLMRQLDETTAMFVYDTTHPHVVQVDDCSTSCKSKAASQTKAAALGKMMVKLVPKQWLGKQSLHKCNCNCFVTLHTNACV